MPSIANAIYAKLSADAAVTAAVATIAGTNSPAIIPNYAPKSSRYPQVVYEVKETERDTTYSGNSGLVMSKITIRCIARAENGTGETSTGYARCNTLGNAVRDSLDMVGGTFGGVVVQRFFLEDDAEDQYEEQDSDKLVFFSRDLTFEVWYLS